METQNQPVACQCSGVLKGITVACAVLAVVLPWFGMMAALIGILLAVVSIVCAIIAVCKKATMFGIIMIVVVEMGLLTPPFGMCVFAVDAAVDKSIGLNVGGIFTGSTPYLLLMALLVIIMIACPSLVTWLPGIM